MAFLLCVGLCEYGVMRNLVVALAAP
ncbi:hypothetical protein GA787_003204 [Vibrio metschnikovii]|nr:hypothetical protein [Vibrio metschnikovii]